MRVSVIGLGDMGSGLAKNLIKAGFDTAGFDLSPDRLAAFAGMGGLPVESIPAAGQGAEVAFVMVMNGDQAKDVILGQGGLTSSMAAGGCVILSATIKPKEAREIGAAMVLEAE